MSISRDDLREVMSEMLNDRRINLDEHGEHHEWIQERIETEKARKDLYREVTRTVIQWSVLGILGGLVFWVQNGHFPK